MILKQPELKFLVFCVLVVGFSVMRIQWSWLCGPDVAGFAPLHVNVKITEPCRGCIMDIGVEPDRLCYQRHHPKTGPF